MKYILPIMVLCLCVAPVAVAQNASHEKNFVSFSFENDSISGRGGDRYYTSGARLSWYNLNTDVPRPMRTLAEVIPVFEINDTTSTMFSLGQNLYTPDDFTNGEAQPNDRPWAGFLYGSVGLSTLTDAHIDELELTLGFVGPEAFGEQTQKLVHTHITGSRTPRGWRHQLEFEPGVIVSWQRRWPDLWKFEAADLAFRAVPNVNASLGNIYTYAGTGVTFTLGPNSYQQDTPPRVRPSMPGSGYFETPDRGWNWQLFASFDGRAVARNIFLDGNSFRDGPSVDKKPLVGDIGAGLAFTLSDYRLAYSVNTRTKEYDGQGVESWFGALTLTMKF